MHEHIEKIKNSGEFSLRYWRELEARTCAINDAREEAWEEAWDVAQAESQRKIAQKLKKRGLRLEEIAEDTGLTVEEVQNLSEDQS